MNQHGRNTRLVPHTLQTRRGAAALPRGIAACLALALGSGCSATTLFQSDFDKSNVGDPPAVVQAVGTATTVGPAGSVKVVASPSPPSGKWVEISRVNGPAVPSLLCSFLEFPGAGKYTTTATLFMPAGSGVSTLQFESSLLGSTAFMHVDFLENDTVRIDDDAATIFGHFPRNAPFIVQVELEIGATSSKAHIVLSGAGASGSADRVVVPALQAASKQFSGVRFLMGFPHIGRFDATNIVVKYKE